VDSLQTLKVMIVGDVLELDAKPLSNRPWHPSVIATLLAGLIGGAAGLLLLNGLHPVFPLADLPELGPYPSKELIEKYSVAEYAFRSRNGATDCGILGGCLGLFFGLLTAGNYRVKAMISSALAGVLAGAIGGYVVGLMVAASIVSSAEQSLLQSTTYHAMIWAPIGAAISGAIALLHSPRQLLPALLAGLVGGIVGSIAYNVLASILYPLSNLSIITPDTLMERLVWIGSGVLGLGACLLFGLRSAPARPQAT
jgi:uncharacterized membrane protein YeaQ/YmgE (transglycosylase-associated protein family)